MQGRRFVAGFALVMALAAGAAAVGESLTPLQAKARFASARRTGEPRHTLKLKALVNPGLLLDVHDSAEHDLFISLGGTTLCDVRAGSEGAEGYRYRRNRWRFKGEGAGGRVKVQGDPLTGRVTIKLTRADLRDLRDGDGTDLSLVIDVGGVALEAPLSVEIRDGRVKRWGRLRTTGGGGSGPPDNGAGPVAFSTLTQGMDTDVFPRHGRVARNQSEWSALWAHHTQFHPAQQPAVDFSRDMVIGVFLGVLSKPSSPGMTNTPRVLSVTDGPSSRVVLWEEFVDGAAWSCPPPGIGAPCVQPRAFQFVVAPQSTLPVTFSAR